MGYVLYFVILLIILSGSLFFYKGKERNTLIAFVSLVFVFKFFLILVNERLQIFEAKFAGNYAIELYELYKTKSGPNFSGRDFIYYTFILQSYINFIPFEIFGANRYVLILTNSFIISLTSIYAFYNLLKSYGKRVAYFALIIINLLPVTINFSLFGLRDPIIFFLVTVNILSLLRFQNRKSTINFLLMIISTLGILSLRPEMVAFIFLPYFVAFKDFFLRIYSKAGNPETKLFFLVLFFCGGIIPVLGLTFVLYQKVLSSIGVTSLISPLEIVTSLAENRFSRWGEDDGGGSNILPSSLYLQLHWLPRWILQSLGIIVLPFPWQITSLSKVLAFIDSLVIIYLISFYRKFQRYVSGLFFVKNIRVLFLTFIFGVLIMGVILSNAGNAFRMRLSILPYIIIMASIIWGEKTKKNG